jgi:hypothetical protein
MIRYAGVHLKMIVTNPIRPNTYHWPKYVFLYQHCLYNVYNHRCSFLRQMVVCWWCVETLSFSACSVTLGSQLLLVCFVSKSCDTLHSWPSLITLFLWHTTVRMSVSVWFEQRRVESAPPVSNVFSWVTVNRKGNRLWVYYFMRSVWLSMSSSINSH